MLESIHGGFFHVMYIVLTKKSASIAQRESWTIVADANGTFPSSIHF